MSMVRYHPTQTTPIEHKMYSDASRLARFAYSKYASRTKTSAASGSTPATPPNSGRKRARTESRSAGVGSNPQTGTGPSGYIAPGRKRKQKKGSKRPRKYRKTNKKSHKKTVQFKDCIYKGFTTVQEVTGTVTDITSVYLGVSTYPQFTLLEMWMAAALRVLFRKGVGTDFTGMDELLPGIFSGSYPTGAISNYKILYTEQDKSTGTYHSFTYVTVATDTIRTLVGNKIAGTAATMSAVMDRLIYINAGGGPSDTTNVRYPHKLILYVQTEYSAGDETWQIASQINLHQMKVYYTSKCELKVQNRSTGASGSVSADDISVTPLDGRLFAYNGNQPMAKVENQWEFENQNLANGINIQVGATMNAANKSVPNKAIFKNCVSASKVLINPGQVQWFNITHQGKGDFNSLVASKLCLRVAGGAGVMQARRGLGVHQMLGLEDVINVQTAQNIVIAYELKRYIGCYVSFKNKTASNSDRTAVSYSNS